MPVRDVSAYCRPGPRRPRSLQLSGAQHRHVATLCHIRARLLDPRARRAGALQAQPAGCLAGGQRGTMSRPTVFETLSKKRAPEVIDVDGVVRQLKAAAPPARSACKQDWALTPYLAQDAGADGASAQKQARGSEQHDEAEPPNKFSGDDVLRRVASSAQGGGVLLQQLQPASFYGTAKHAFATATRGLAAAWGVRRTAHAADWLTRSTRPTLG